MNTALKPNTAIVVTRHALIGDRYVLTYLRHAQEHAQIILLDENPNSEIALPEFEWDVVISNTGLRPANFFVMNALGVLKEASNLVPVIAVDGLTDRPNTLWTDAGILWVVTSDQL